MPRRRSRASVSARACGIVCGGAKRRSTPSGVTRTRSASTPSSAQSSSRACPEGTSTRAARCTDARTPALSTTRSRSVNHSGCRRKETSWTVTTDAARGRERRRVGGVDDARAVVAGIAATSPTARRATSERRGSTTRWWAPTSTSVPATATSSRRPELLEAREQPAHVGLVAGLARAEHVPVDQDARGHEAGSPPAPRPGAHLGLDPGRRRRRPGRARAAGARAPRPRRRRHRRPPRRRGRRRVPSRVPASAPRTPTAARRGRGAGGARGRRAAWRCGWPRAAGRADRRRTPRRPAAAGR